MRRWISSIVLGCSLAIGGVAIAAEPEHVAEAISSTPEVFPHPDVSHDGSWAGAMAVIILLCFFLPAAIIGPIVRANTPEEVPPAHSHDEPPGTSGHHGSSGTHTETPHH